MSQALDLMSKGTEVTGSMCIQARSLESQVETKW